MQLDFSASPFRGAKVFVDESKSKDYLLAGAIILPDQDQQAKKDLRALLHPGQSRLHMKQERDSKRKQILQTIVALDIQVYIYRVPQKTPQIEARRLCLEALSQEMLSQDMRILRLESDESMNHRDRQVLSRYLKTLNATDKLRFEHLAPAADPLLWVPDAVAWAWAKGGHWKDSVKGIVTESPLG